jgi:hypothetical protein
VAPVHNTGFVAMQMHTVAGESDEVSHERICRRRSFTLAVQ